jgi:hypothetical protein
MIGRLKFNIDNIVMDIIKKIPDSVWNNPNATFLDPAMGGGQFVKAIEQKLRECGYSDESIRHRVFGLESNIMRVDFAVNKYKLIGNYSVVDFLNWETDMKFDVMVGNPPYQTQVGPSKTEPMWDKFVKKSFDILNDDGYLALIHPSGWRNVDGRFTDVRDLLLSRQMEYLEIHNEKDGLQTFGAETRYDWYVVKNTSKKNKNTLIKFEDGSEEKINLKNLPFIPNHTYEKVSSLVASSGEDTVEVLYSRSAYGTDKKHVSKTKSKKFKYPVVYTINSESVPTFHWSSDDSNGHFNVPKLIWSNGRISSVGSYIDEKGKYALTQFAYAIVDSPKNLNRIKKAFDSKEFRDLMYACSVGQLMINYKILSTFRKDFWKEFV